MFLKIKKIPKVNWSSKKPYNFKPRLSTFSFLCFGLILYSIGSRAIPAAELTLLSLTEVIGGIFWVWLPLFGINEVPSTNTIIGGFFLFISLIYYSLIMRWNKRYIALN